MEPASAAEDDDEVRPSLTVSAFDMHLHAATTFDGRDRKQFER